MQYRVAIQRWYRIVYAVPCCDRVSIGLRYWLYRALKQVVSGSDTTCFKMG